MIKAATIGMYDVAKVNPTITSATDVTNHQFITHEGETYLVSNTPTGDDSYRDDVVIKAGEFLNGYMLKAWEGQELVVDEKHITYGDSEGYTDITKGTTLLTVGTDGKLAIADEAPSAGVYFKVTDKTTLTEKAVKALIIVA